MKLSAFETPRFSNEIEARNMPLIPLVESEIKDIAKKFPPSIKKTHSLYNGILSFYSKRVSMGHNEIEITRRGKYLIGIKSYSTSNNTDKIMAVIY